jgi:hypothetical protein
VITNDGYTRVGTCKDGAWVGKVLVTMDNGRPNNEEFDQ